MQERGQLPLLPVPNPDHSQEATEGPEEEGKGPAAENPVARTPNPGGSPALRGSGKDPGEQNLDGVQRGDLERERIQQREEAEVRQARPGVAEGGPRAAE